MERLPITDPSLRKLVCPVCVHTTHGLVLQNHAAVPVRFLIRFLAAMCSSSEHCILDTSRPFLINKFHNLLVLLSI